MKTRKKSRLKVKEAQRLIIELVNEEGIHHEISYGSVSHKIEQIINQVPKSRMREMTATLLYAHLILEK